MKGDVRNTYCSVQKGPFYVALRNLEALFKLAKKRLSGSYRSYVISLKKQYKTVLKCCSSVMDIMHFSFYLVERNVCTHTSNELKVY